MQWPKEKEQDENRGRVNKGVLGLRRVLGWSYDRWSEAVIEGEYMKKGVMINIGLKITTQKTKDWATRIPLKTRGELCRWQLRSLVLQNSESDYFFSSTKIRIFFSATLGIRIFFRKKNITPPFKLNGPFLTNS
jgi:hypothetical protein